MPSRRRDSSTLRLEQARDTSSCSLARMLIAKMPLWATKSCMIAPLSMQTSTSGGLCALVLEVQSGGLAPRSLGYTSGLVVLAVFLLCAMAAWARGPVGGALGFLAAGPLADAIATGQAAVPGTLVQLCGAVGAEGFAVTLAAACGALALVASLAADGASNAAARPR